MAGITIDRGMNQINNGTGMLYTIPFGDLEKANLFDSSHTMAKIREEESFQCGVAAPDDFVGNLTEANGLVGMSVDYCRAVASALFTGNPDMVTLVMYRKSDDDAAYSALANGTIDVLVGLPIEFKREFRVSQSLGGEGFHFSTPYFFAKNGDR